MPWVSSTVSASPLAFIASHQDQNQGRSDRFLEPQGHFADSKAFQKPECFGGGEMQ
jgi:hypothetical protein